MPYYIGDPKRDPNLENYNHLGAGPAGPKRERRARRTSPSRPLTEGGPGHGTFFFSRFPAFLGSGKWVFPGFTDVGISRFAGLKLGCDWDVAVVVG